MTLIYCKYPNGSIWVHGFLGNQMTLAVHMKTRLSDSRDIEVEYMPINIISCLWTRKKKIALRGNKTDDVATFRNEGRIEALFEWLFEQYGAVKFFNISSLFM